MISSTDVFAELMIFRTFKDESHDGSSVLVVSDFNSTIADSTAVDDFADVVVDLSSSLDDNGSLKFILSED